MVIKFFFSSSTWMLICHRWHCSHTSWSTDVTQVCSAVQRSMRPTSSMLPLPSQIAGPALRDLFVCAKEQMAVTSRLGSQSRDHVSLGPSTRSRFRAPPFPEEACPCFISSSFWRLAALVTRFYSAVLLPLSPPTVRSSPAGILP